MIVDRLVVGGGRLDFEDATLAPPYHAALEPLGLDLQDLTTIPNETGTHTVTARLLGGAEIRWTGGRIEPLRFEGRIEVTNLALPRIWEYVGRAEPLDVRQGKVEVSLDYLLERDAADRLRAELDNGAVTVSDLAVQPRRRAVAGRRAPRRARRARRMAGPHVRRRGAALRDTARTRPPRGGRHP